MSAPAQRLSSNRDPLRAVTPLLELIASQEPLSVLLRALVLFVEQLADEMQCSILLADTATRTLHLGAAPNLPAAYSAAIDNAPYSDGAGSCGTAAARRAMVIVGNIETSPLWRDYRELARAHALAACWSTPLIDSRGELLGTFAMYYARPREPTAGELELLRIAGPLAAMVIQRHRDAERLRASEMRYRQLAETCPDAILAYARETISYANSAAARLLGVDTAEELVGQRLGRFWGEDAITALLQHRHGMHAFRVRRADGTMRPIEVAASEMAVDGTATVVLVCRDVSDRRSLETEIIDAASREQERLGYDLHDGIGQQLTGVSLLLRSLQARARDAAVPIAADVDRINSLVVGTIEETRALATGMSPVAVERAGLAAALTTLGAQAESLYGLTVAVHQGPGPIPELTPARATHLYRITQEAIRNAARHGQARRVDVRLACRGTTLTLTITDDGVGFPEGALESHGLGLRSMRYRAERLGGTVRIEPRPPHGTTIRVECPAPAL